MLTLQLKLELMMMAMNYIISTALTCMRPKMLFYHINGQRKATKSLINVKMVESLSMILNPRLNEKFINMTLIIQIGAGWQEAELELWN